MKTKERKYYQQLRLNVKKKAATAKKQSGGCFKHEVQMNQQPNFLDAQNANTLGETMHKL